MAAVKRARGLSGPWLLPLATAGLLLGLLLGGCREWRPTVSSPLSPTATATRQASGEATAVRAATATATEAARAGASAALATVAPVLTATTAPPLMATRIISPGVAITADNVQALALAAQFGRGRVEQLALSGDGQTVAVAGSAGLYLYDAATLSLERFLASSSPLLAVAFATDEASRGSLLTVDADGVLRCYGLAEGELLDEQDSHSEGVTAAAIAPETGVAALVAGSQRSGAAVRVVELATGELQHVVTAHRGRAAAVRFDPEGETLATAGNDGMVYLWSTADWAELAGARTGGGGEGVPALAFSEEGTRFAAGGEGMLLTWRQLGGGWEVGQQWPDLLATPPPVTTPGALHDLAFSSEGDALLEAGEALQIRPLASEMISTTLAGEGAANALLAEELVQMVVAGGERLVALGADGLLHGYSLADGAELSRSEATQPHLAGVARLALRPDGTTLALGGGQAAVWLWEWATADGIGRLEAPEPPTALAFSPSGEVLAAGQSGSVRLWELPQGEERDSLEAAETVRSLAFTPTGDQLAAGDDSGLVKLWRVESGIFRRNLLPDWPAPSTGLAFAPNGANLLAATTGGVENWTASRWEVVYRIGAGGKMVVSADWHMVAVLSPGGVELYDGQDGTLLYTLPPVIDGASGETTTAFESGAFSPSGDMLALGDSQGRILFWHARERRPLHTLSAHNGAVTGLAFSRDGRLLASSSGDGTARVWAVGAATGGSE